MGDEDWYALARDTETDAVFIQHGWSHRVKRGFEHGSVSEELADFLKRQGSAQNQLLALIGTLVKDA